MTQEFHITLCNEVKTKAVKHLDPMTWPELVEWFKTPITTVNRLDHVSGKRIDWALFVPAHMKTREEGAALQDYDYRGKPAYSRSKENTISVNAIVLDIDNDPAYFDSENPSYDPKRFYLSVEEGLAMVEGLSFIFYTSFNHMNKDKHGGVDKFRIILPLAKPATMDELQERKHALRELFPSADPAGFTISQPFYVPMLHPYRADSYRFEANTGTMFDVFELEAKAKIVPSTVYRSTGELHVDASTFVRTVKYGESTAEQLWHWMSEGYENRLPAYKLDAPDNNPGCYIIKDGGSLRHHREDSSLSARIQVFKAEKVEDDTPPLLWKRKSSSALPKRAEKIEPTDTKNTLKLEAPSDIIVLNDRYLDGHALSPLFPRKGTTLLKSAKGTAKTVTLSVHVAQLQAEKQPVLLIGHRVNLIRAIASDLDLDFYQDFADDEGIRSNNLAISFDSLPRIEAFDYANATVIIDESEQGFLHLLSDTLKSKHARRTHVLNALFYIMKNAKAVIVSDADLSSELTVAVLKLLRGEEKMESEPWLAVHNKYVFENRQTVMYADMFQLLAEAVGEATKSPANKLFISTNYKDSGAVVFGEVFARALEGTDRKVLVISADTSATDEVREFMDDPSEVSKQYDVVICTPTAQTGISIDNDHFTHVYGFFWDNIGTYQDVDQAMSRVRQVNLHRLWMQEVKNGQRDQRTATEAFYDALEAERHARVNLDMIDSARFTNNQVLWARVESILESLLKTWTVNKPAQFVKLREENGYEFSAADENEEMKKLGKNIYEEADTFKKPHRAIAIWEAAEITPEEHDELTSKTRRTEEEYLQVQRYRFAEKLGTDFDFDNLKKAVDQNLLKAIGMLNTYLNWTREQRIAFDTKAREAHSTAFKDATHVTIDQALLETLLKAAGLDLATLIKQVQASLTSGEDIVVSADQLLAFAEAAHDKEKQLKRYRRIRIVKPSKYAIEDSKDAEKLIRTWTTKMWSAVIGDVLPLKRDRFTVDGEKRQRMVIDVKKCDSIAKYFVLNEAPKQDSTIRNAGLGKLNLKPKKAMSAKELTTEVARQSPARTYSSRKESPKTR